MTRQGRAFALVGLLSSLGLVQACGDEPAPVQPAPRPKAPPQPAAIAEVADAGTLAPVEFQYAYNPLGKRDPFRVWRDDPSAADDAAPCNEPLCQWDLDQLTLVAVVSGDANPIGMLEDPGRVGHIVRRNTKVGRQGGKVTQVLRDCVVVTEYWTGPDGRSNPNPVKICIKQEELLGPVRDLLNPGKKL